MRTLGIILARAGSKGVPDKCVRLLLGRPLIDFTFDHALEAQSFCDLVLTSDSAGALARARERGVATISRPAELACAAARVDLAALHALQTWERRTGQAVDAVVLLYGNVPVRAAGIIDRCVTHLEATAATSVRTVAPIGAHHPDWLHRLSGDRMQQYRPNGSYRRQDLEPLYYHDGAVCAVRADSLRAAAQQSDDGQAFLGSDRRAIIQASHDTVDVDEWIDFYVAEAILRAAGVRPEKAQTPEPVLVDCT